MTTLDTSEMTSGASAPDDLPSLTHDELRLPRYEFEGVRRIRGESDAASADAVRT
jgi:hypothetical protein